MVSKSTKKNRRQKKLSNDSRARLQLFLADKRVDFWLIGIRHSRTKNQCQWIEVYGRDKAIRSLRRISSMMGSESYRNTINPQY